MTQPIPNPSGQSLTPTSDERTWAVLGHLAAIVAAVISVGWLSFVGPLLIWAVYKDRSAFVRKAAADSFNFNLAVWASIIAVVAALWFHIRAAMAASRGESFRYPWSIPVLH